MHRSTRSSTQPDKTAHASRSNPKVQKIENITPHMLRHAYATILYDVGVDIKTAQRYLGHADVQTTLKIYTHLSETKQAQSLNALNALFDALDAEQCHVESTLMQ